MARRHLTLTLEITLDEDACRADDQPSGPDGDSPYHDTLHLLRTVVSHDASVMLTRYDPHLSNPEISYNGITYLTP